MKIISVEKSKAHTVLQLDKGDGDNHFHAIPDGIIEDRMAAWDLETPEEALDLLIAEAHAEDDEELPNRFAITDLTTAKRDMKSLVSKRIKDVTYDSGISKTTICEMAKLPPAQAKVVRDNIKHELAAGASDLQSYTMSAADSLMIAKGTSSRIAEGIQEFQKMRDRADKIDKGKN